MFMRSIAKKGLYGLVSFVGYSLVLVFMLLMYGVLSFNDYVFLALGFGVLIKIVWWQIKIWMYVPATIVSEPEVKVEVGKEPEPQPALQLVKDSI
jgi:hypothetical protein